MNARAAIHSIWESFVLPLVFGMSYASAAAWALGIDFNQAIKDWLALGVGTLEDASLTSRLRDLDLLKLLPLAVLFALAFVLYVFDRLVSVVATTLPPQPIWRGLPLLYLGKDRLLHLWALCPKAGDIAELSREMDRLVEAAYEQSRVRLTGTLDWTTRKASDASRVAGYCKAFVYFSLIGTALAAASRSAAPGTFGRGVVLIILGLAAYLLALLYQTHELFESTDRQLWVAERMRESEGAEFLLDSDRRDLLEEVHEATLRRTPRPTLSLSWGSIVPWRRLFTSMWWRGA
jgi:hypothetical protein